MKMSGWSLHCEGRESGPWVYWAGGVALAGTFLARTIYNWRKQRTVRERMNLLRHERELSLRNLERRLEGVVDLSLVEEVGSLPLTTLAERLKSGQLKPTEVLRVYQWRALQSHRRTNCLLRAVDEAEEWAQRLEQDETRSGALYGIPVSLKENIALKGHRYSHGVTTFMDDFNDRDTVLVEVLKEQGAIPYVVTNYPQTYMSLETQNPIYGATSNPLDTRRTPGGSSGGEAALLASGGSILGMGSDIGGSIRCPCHFCGICGFKPTYPRISQKGEGVWGQMLVLPSCGPMARDVDDVVLVMKALFVHAMHGKHRIVPPMPFRHEDYTSQRQLRIGYHVDDGYHLASPPCARAVLMTKEVLERKGHILVPWSMGPRAHFGRNIWNKAIAGDEGESFRSIVRDDPVDPCIKLLYGLATTRPIMRRIKIWLAKLSGNRRWAELLTTGAGTASVTEWWAYIEEVEHCHQEVEQSWQEAGLDALICPPAVTPACKLGHAGELYAMGSYGMIYSALNYPAGVVPVTKVNAEDIALTKSFHTGDPLDVFVRNTVDESAEGLPVGVQCVTRRWRDELCLRVLKEIQDGILHTSS